MTHDAIMLLLKLLIIATDTASMVPFRFDGVFVAASQLWEAGFSF